MSASAFRAITTRYKGYKFRSRLEARWAVFFDHLGIRWDYEPEGFELGNGLRYLPDFWLPDLKTWVEIKPGASDHAAREKASRLVSHTGCALFMSNGLPDRAGELFISKTRYGEDAGCPGTPVRAGWIAAAGKKALPFFVSTDSAPPGRVANDQGALVWASTEGPKQSGEAVGGPPKALDAARGSRFEFGQEGA